jgi:hypothetical protein
MIHYIKREKIAMETFEDAKDSRVDLKWCNVDEVVSCSSIRLIKILSGTCIYILSKK